MRSLKTVAQSELGLDLTGWNLTAATAISADGTKLAGTGTDPNGRTEAWLLVVPEPGVMALSALAVLVLFWRRGGRRLSLPGHDCATNCLCSRSQRPVTT
jgi:hypothetical protein